MDAGLDLSNLNYSNNSFDVVDAPGVSPPITRSSARSVRFNADGTKMYILADRDDIANQFNYLYEYVLSTPYDITTASYNRTDQLQSEGFVKDLVIFPNEEYVFYTTNQSDIVRVGFNEANFSISSVSDQEVTLPTDPIEALAFNTDGTRFYTVVKAGNDEYTINQYNLSFPYSINNRNLQASFTSNIGGFQFNTAPQDIVLNADESKLFFIGSNGNQFFSQNAYQLSMDPPGDVSTLSSEASLNHTSEGQSGRSLAFDPSGKKLFLLIAGVVYEYS